MTPDQHARVREIFDEAVTLNTGLQSESLARETDPEIRKEVEKLLRAHRQLPTWLERPALAPIGALKLAGRCLHGYTLSREIGRGGMGCVYLAERSDGAFQKQVAIKLVQPGPNAADIVARFRQEREILASLDHPNIAKLIDGGATEEGWPYFVMEYVDGLPIDKWCDERKLDVSGRIELFRGVLAAVRFAHQRLVVHRDLKPGNILVTQEGTVKLLDFGIAKLLPAKDSPEAAATQTMARLLTPDYASPEQITGIPITTLTDVYSLGVVLYELLTGHRPYRLLSAAMHELARVIAEVEPARPSQVVTSSPEGAAAVPEGDTVRLSRRLAGDLDAILLMTLRKEPEARYGSVDALADDLQRHLEQRPVAARPASSWYRCKRFCARNSGGVAAAAFLAIAFLSGFSAVIWQTRQNLEWGSPSSPAPLWGYFCGLTTVGLGIAYYFVRPGRANLFGAVSGGTLWAASIVGKYWLGDSLGWWRSRIAGDADPLRLFSPTAWLVFELAAITLMLLLLAIGRRFGWKGQAVAIAIVALGGEFRERLYYADILPGLTYAAGLTPVLLGAAITLTGGILGLLALRCCGRD